MDSSLKKTHFLKPSIDDELPPSRSHQSFSLSSKESDVLSKKICEKGFRFANPDFSSWAKKMEALHEPTWKKAGIFKAIKASTYRISSDPSLVLALVEKWCPETKSFIFPWGEATVTLEDVMVVLEFPVLGGSVIAPLESLEMRDSVKELEKGMVENMASDNRVAPQKWVESFRSRDDEIEHDAFLAMWLSLFVFPNAWRSSISKDVFPIAVRLARGEKLALAPAVLASLYRDLGLICAFARDKSTRNVSLKSLFKLVQVWIWERFRNIRPKALELQKGEPRIAQWSYGKQGFEKKETVSFDDFEWRPYAKPLKNWSPPRFYVEEGKWMTIDDSLDDEFVSFARCLRVSQLVGIGFVEDYYPHRVALQFGFSQDLPCLVTDQNFTELVAWEDYDKPLKGLKFYVPSRSATTCVTSRYHEWWLRSVSEFLSSQEYTATATLAKPKTHRKRRKAKEVGSASREVPLSEMFQKVILKRTSEHLRNKQAPEDDDENSTDCDDNITIAEVIKARKKAGENAEKISDCVGSASKEVPLSKLFRKKLAKATSEHLRNKRCKLVHEDDDVTIAETGGHAFESVRRRSRKFQVVDSEDSEPSESVKKGSRLAKKNNDSGIRHLTSVRRRSRKFQVVDSEDSEPSESIEKGTRLAENKNSSGIRENLASGDDKTAELKIEPKSEENDGKETGSKALKRTVLIVNNSSDPSLDPSRGKVETIVSEPETKKACDVEVGLNGHNADKNAMMENGIKGEETLLSDNGEKLGSEAKKEDNDERWKQRKLAIEELAMNLEARMMKVEKTLAMIREWKTRRSKIQNDISS